jgi:putative redox protein
MTKITASIAKELYKVELKSPSGNTVIADEPVKSGGKDLGFSPKELLIAALASCTSVTLRMYADTKGWPLEKVNINIELLEVDTKTTFVRHIELVGITDEKQRTRLLHVANACPVHKILTNPIGIETDLI